MRNKRDNDGRVSKRSSTGIRRDGAAEKRERLAKFFDLPRGMTANALLEALNLLFDYETYKSALASLAEE